MTHNQQLLFSSSDAALQYLANITKARIKVARKSLAKYFWESVEEFLNESSNDSLNTLGFKLHTDKPLEGTFSGFHHPATRTSPEEFPEFNVTQGNIRLIPGIRKFDVKQLPPEYTSLILKQFPELHDKNDVGNALLNDGSPLRQQLDNELSNIETLSLAIAPDKTLSNLFDESFMAVDVPMQVSGKIVGTTLFANVKLNNKSAVERLKQRLYDRLYEITSKQNND